MESKISSYWDLSETLIIRYAGSAILAIIVLIIGWWAIKKLSSYLSKMMERKKVDISLRPFLKSIIIFSLKILLIVAVAGMAGIKTTSFIAILGAAGLAIGLALQGSLSNFAGGVIILLLKPFVVGEFIEYNTMSGTVREIHVFYTYLTTANKQELVIPNGQLANAPITNYSRHDSRGLSMTFRVSYESDLDKIKSILEEIISSESALVKDPAHYIYVRELGEKYVLLNLQAWIKTEKFGNVSNALPEKVKKRLDSEGIQIPTPSMDIRLKQE